MKPLLSLCLVVKNEAETIRQVLESAKPFVDHFVVMIDRESTDETETIVRATLGDVSKEIFRSEWLGYAETRNVGLELVANATVFTLMFSGDEYLRDGVALREFLETHRDTTIDAFRIRLTLDGSTNFTPRVFRTYSQWRYKDDDCGVHEYPAHPDPNAEVGTVPRAFIEHIPSSPEKRFENIEHVHIPALRAALDRNPNNERALMFLAQSHEALFLFYEPWERRTYMLEAMGLYMRRLAIDSGSEHERNYCRMRYLTDSILTGVYTPTEIYARAIELFKNDPMRPECAMLRARAAHMAGVSVGQIYTLACEAAKVASDAAEIENHSPRSGDIAWQAHLMAAKCALQIFRKVPEAADETGTLFQDLAHQHVEMGLEVGGPVEHFSPIVEALAAPPEAVAAQE